MCPALLLVQLSVFRVIVLCLEGCVAWVSELGGGILEASVILLLTDRQICGLQGRFIAGDAGTAVIWRATIFSG